MPAAGLVKYAYLAYFAKPAADRQLYRLIKQECVCRIVELGIGSLSRAAHLIAVAQRYSPQAEIHYAAVDWFDTRPAGMSPLTLIETHRRLQATGAKVRLLPGDPGQTLSRVANSLLRTDLLLLDREVTDAGFARAWFYVPRMCHGRTTVLRAAETAGEVAYHPLSAGEIVERAALATPARAA